MQLCLDCETPWGHTHHFVSHGLTRYVRLILQVVHPPPAPPAVIAHSPRQLDITTTRALVVLIFQLRAASRDALGESWLVVIQFKVELQCRQTDRRVLG